MLIDDLRTKEVLRKIVARLTPDRSVRDDLMQEASIHLWLQEERRPNQTTSWYLQNCQYYLRNYLARGRSVDSHKRRGRLPYEPDDSDHSPYGYNGDGAAGGVFGNVSARDIVSALTKRLTVRQQQILDYLSQGYRAREIARKLGISHPAVVKHRQQIAQTALRLGIVPLPNNHAGTNGRRLSEVKSEAAAEPVH